MSFPRIRLRLLGQFGVFDESASAPIRLSTKKACALLAFVALSPGQSVGRERAASLLWGSCSDRLARQSLRQALVRLRKELPSPDLLETETDRIKLQNGALTVDVLELQSLSASSQIDDLRRAVSLAEGEFLSDFHFDEEAFDDWLQQQRRHAQLLCARVLEAYCAACFQKGMGNEALAAVERLLELDPLREDWQRLTLQAYARYRGRNEALAQAKLFEALLKRELDVPPEPQTLALIEKIRRVGADTTAPIQKTDRRDRGSTKPTDLAESIISSAASRCAGQLSTLVKRHMIAGLAAVLIVIAISSLTYSLAVPPSAQEKLGKISERSIDQDSWQSPPLPGRTEPRVVARDNKMIAVAVLPFTTYGDTASSTELIAEMITDDLINILARVPVLRVISRQTSRTFRNKDIDVAQIGAELGVRYIMEGNLRKENENYHVNVELVDPKTRQLVWSARIERAGHDRGQIQHEIVGRLARELQLEVFQVEANKTSSTPDVSELTYKGYAAMLSASSQGRAALEQAKAYFDEALSLAPDSGGARRGLGAYHVLLAAQMFTTDPLSHVAEAERLLQQDIRQDQNASSAHFFMGMVHELRGRRPDAIQSFQRAIEINPSYALAYAQMGHVLIAQGQAAQALDLIHYALRLSPRDPHRSHWFRFAGEAELELRRYEPAINYLKQSVALNPNHPLSLRSLVAAHGASGNDIESRKYLDKLKAVAPNLSQDQLLRRPLTGQPELARGLTTAFALPPG